MDNTTIMKEYTILCPNMCPLQFSLLKAALESEGYKHIELLGSSSPDVSRLGLKYVHNDTCYPALIVIGQFLEAIESGKYDLEHLALLISQTGGGCRASNYLKLLRKALIKAGYPNIPVLSFNATGLEEGSCLKLNLAMGLKMLVAVELGDMLVALRNQLMPYEKNEGQTEAMVTKWLERFDQQLRNNERVALWNLKQHFEALAKDFASIPLKKEQRVKVGVVGEIYVKYSPTGNNNLQKILEAEGCEVNMPGLMGFVEYCLANWQMDTAFYGLNPKLGRFSAWILKYLQHLDHLKAKALKKYGLKASDSFEELMEKPTGIIDLGTKMGEGWLLTAEMIELIQSGYPNIICAQPFGCLPNHICGKGVIKRIKELYPVANIMPIDYDPSATSINQENRIKLMLAVAKENLKADS